jgi:hypothetical protein
MVMPALEDTAALRRHVRSLRQDQLTVAQFSALARAPKTWLNDLPPAFSTVWDNLLDRLESSALFSGDSCSFSQTDLLASFDMWLDKAEAKLSTQA